MGHSNIDLAKGECAGVEQFSLVFTRNLEVCFPIHFFIMQEMTLSVLNETAVN